MVLDAVPDGMTPEKYINNSSKRPKLRAARRSP